MWSLATLCSQWLLMTSTLLLILRIYRNQFKWNYLTTGKLFFNFLLNFWNLSQILNIFKQNMTLIAHVFPKLWTGKEVLDKCLKSAVSENPATANMLNGVKYCWNLYDSTFTIFFNPSDRDWVQKYLSYWYKKSWNCLFTHWLPMKIILFVTERISRNQFKWNYLTQKNLSFNVLLNFWNLHQIYNILKRKMTFIAYVFPKLQTAK